MSVASKGAMHPLRGLRALLRWRRDPEDGEALAAIGEGLDGPFFEAWFRRFEATRVGRRVILEQRDLLSLLADRWWLSGLPPGSLGRAYLEFAGREESVSPGHAVSAPASGPDGPDDRTRFAQRISDQHDLVHVVAGYGREPAGEVSVLAFEAAQMPSPGNFLVALVASAGLGLDRLPILWRAFQRGRRAAWLPAADWEALLEMPLTEARALLGMAATLPPDPVRRERAA